MPSFSEVALLGYVGNPVELKRGPKANYLQLSIGVSTSYRVRPNSREWKQKTRWIKVMFFGKYADWTSERVRKSDLVHIKGMLEVNVYTGKDGIKRYEMYVLGRTAILVKPKKARKPDQNYGVPEDEISDDDPGFE